jgi:hypothetical protein
VLRLLLGEGDQVTHHQIPQLQISGRYTVTDNAWKIGQGGPNIIRCDHETDPDRFLCSLCAADLELCLADIPALVDDLDTAITRQTAFVEHGIRPHISDPDDETVVDAPGQESPLPYSPAASNARRRLTDALQWGTQAVGDNPTSLSRWWLAYLPTLLLHQDIAAAADRISYAVLKAHEAIDRPADRQHLGQCPNECGRDLEAERGDETVTCLCGYTVNVIEHVHLALSRVDDMMMTDTELVGAVELAGEPIRRTQIHSWVRTGRLEAHVQMRHVWRGGTIVAIERKVYKLGEVRALAEGAKPRWESA